MGTQLQVRPFVFRKAEWETSGELENASIRGIPGTWWKKPGDFKVLPGEIFALFCCPNCGKTSALHERIHRLDEFGKVVRPDTLGCMYPGCSFHRVAYLDRWNLKPLYAVAVERVSPAGKVKPEMHYCHATNEREARAHLGNSVDATCRIVAVAPAIGFFVEDKHGDVLSAD